MAARSSKPIWQDISLPKFDRLSQSGHFDVVVIGGGIAGFSAAYFLKQAGNVFACWSEIASDRATRAIPPRI